MSKKTLLERSARTVTRVVSPQGAIKVFGQHWKWDRSKTGQPYTVTVYISRFNTITGIELPNTDIVTRIKPLKLQ